jgi:hypothetical protein
MEVVPMQLFALSGGGYCLRIGNSSYWFDRDGSYDGPEHNFPGKSLTPEEAMEVEALLDGCQQTRHEAPETPYFDRGTKGWEAEIAGWPAEGRKQEIAIAQAEAMARLSDGRQPEKPRLYAKPFKKEPKN